MNNVVLWVSAVATNLLPNKGSLRNLCIMMRSCTLSMLSTTVVYQAEKTLHKKQQGLNTMITKGK